MCVVVVFVFVVVVVVVVVFIIIITIIIIINLLSLQPLSGRDFRWVNYCFQITVCLI
jgi:hypothetical protein